MLKTTCLDPSFFSKTRIEFKLPSSNEVIMSSSMEITNFGLVQPAQAGPLLKYGGIYNLITNAYLYSGTMELESLYNANAILCARMLYGDADLLASRDEQQSQATLTANGTLANNSLTGTLMINRDIITLPDTATATPALLSGNVKLSDLFPLVASLQQFVNFPNLRVVLELTNVMTDFLVTGTPPASYELLSPVLKFESVSDEAIKQAILKDQQNYGVVQWMSIYSEQQNVADGLTSASLKLRGFTGKLVNDIIVQTVPTLIPSDPYIGFGYSVPLTTEQMQLTVNNVKLLPLNGLDTPAKKIESMTPYRMTGLFGSAMPRGTGFNNYSNSVTNLFGKLSFGRFDVKARVSDLQFDLQSSAIPADGETLRFIGKCAKNLARDKMGNVLLVGY